MEGGKDKSVSESGPALLLSGTGTSSFSEDSRGSRGKTKTLSKDKPKIVAREGKKQIAFP